MSARFTRRARALTFAGLATVGLAAVAQLAVSPSAMSAESHTVLLHNTTAGSGKCDQSPPLWGWHFVAPANSTFVSVSVTFQTEGTVTKSSGFGPPDASHAYIYLSHDDTVVSGTAEIVGDADKFVLSHVCAGTTSETPTPTPSESPSESPSQSPSESPSQSPSESPSESPSQSPSESPSETVSETPSQSPSETVSESPSVSPSETASETPTPEVSGTVVSQSPSGTPDVKGVRVTRKPAVKPVVEGSRLPSTGSPLPIGLLLLVGFGLIAGGVVVTVTGEHSATPGGKHRA